MIYNFVQRLLYTLLILLYVANIIFVVLYIVKVVNFLSFSFLAYKKFLLRIDL